MRANVIRQNSLFFLCLSLVIGGQATTLRAQSWPGKNFPNPNRPDATAMFMANGIFDADDTDYVPPTGEDFDQVIMGRDESEAADRKQEAIDYFLERFGVDFNESDFAQGGSVILVHTYSDPRWNYRCYKLPYRWVPSSGLIVHDAQWVMFVVGPSATLYGSWGGEDGIEVPGGTAAVDGEYLIQGTNKFRRGHWRNVYIKFSSVSPIFGAATGDIKFDCRLDHWFFGSGAALGRQEFYQLSDGQTQIAINNVLQFPAPAWSTDDED